MNTTKKIAVRRDAFTLIEMMVVIAIILALAALAAAFAPRVNENQKMTRAVDNLEQWLLTAKLRAKRDGLATGLRFIRAPGDPAFTYSQFQYIQQPEPLLGGVCMGAPSITPVPPPGSYQYPAGTGNYYKGGIITGAGATGSGLAGQVSFTGVDFTLGGLPQVDVYGRQQWLVQTGDYLEINGGGVYFILAAKDLQTLQLGASPYDLTLNMGLTATPPTPPTTNYRIIRQPRILLGEEPLTLPNNYAVVVNPLPPPLGTAFTNTFCAPPNTLGVLPVPVPDTSVPPNPTCNVLPGVSGYPEILFSPTGAVVGTSAAFSTIWISVWDTTMEYVPNTPNLLDATRVGIVGIQSRSGFMGAYGIAFSGDPLYFVRTARESGL